MRLAGAGSAAEVLVSDPKVAGVIPKRGVQIVPLDRKKPKTASGTSAVNPDTKVKSAITKNPKPKPLPTIIWTSLRANLSLREAEARFQIREFVLRFAPVMDTSIAKTHLEELDYIDGRGRGRDEDEEMTSWVSEACTKSIIVALLVLLANDESGTIEKVHHMFCLFHWTLLNFSLPSGTKNSNQRNTLLWCKLEQDMGNPFGFTRFA
jgi:hypothetical protein